MSELLDRRRRRLVFQSTRRGNKEADLLLGAFARRYMDSLAVDQLDRYEALLGQSDPDLLDWISGRAPLPREFDHDVMRLLKSCLDGAA